MGLFGNNGNDEQNDQNEQRMVPRTALMSLVAAYLMYLGFNILRGWYQGDPGMPPWVAVLFGILFIVAGGAYLIYLLLPYLKKKSGEESAAIPENSESAAAPENEEPAAISENSESAAAPENEEPAAIPEKGEPAALPENNESAAATEKEDGKAPSSE